MKTIIDRDRVLKLNDPNITKREYDEIVKAINSRVEYIWTTLLKISNRELGWYSFRNDNWDGGNDGSDGGSFDPEEDGEFIVIIGDYVRRDIDGEFETGFPTRFLWTENDVWTQEVLNHIAENRQKAAEAKSAAKKKKLQEKFERDKIVATIKTKLTNQELKYVRFK